jgi:hypothetical protein
VANFERDGADPRRRPKFEQGDLWARQTRVRARIAADQEELKVASATIQQTEALEAFDNLPKV